MRIDKFLKVVRVIKGRSVANETVDEGNVRVNDKAVKPSYTVKIGDTIVIDMWNYRKEIKVTALPTSNSIKKEDVVNYITEISYTITTV